MRFKISRAFMEGYIKALDMGATTRKYSNYDDANEKDYEALKNDWEETGKEIRRQIKEFAR